MVEYSAQRLDAVFGALADPTRRDLLDRLGERPATVTELARPVPMSLAAVSKHLRVLEGAGLVRRTVVGREHWLSLAPEPLAEAREWMERYRRFWEERIDSLELYLQHRRGAGRPGEGEDAEPGQ